MKISTGVGDGGKTRLRGGKPLWKDDPVVEALGAVDEVNAALGLAKAHGADDLLTEKLEELQKLLHVLGTDVASPRGARAPKNVSRISPVHVAWMEKQIDSLEGILPPLRNFILAGGSPAGAALHLARTLCRRAERALVPLLKKKWASKDAQVFLNRLSDYLFLLARETNRRVGKIETPWLP